MTTDTVNWLASVRGRLGYARGSGLLYFTSGVAWEGISHDATVTAETAPGVYGVATAGSSASTKCGFVLGCGYERLIAEHWTVRGEYLFYDFNQGDSYSLPFSSSSVPGSAAVINTSGNDVHTFRLGLSYKF